MTTSGIEPATFWFVAQYLNHCAIAVPVTILTELKQFNVIHFSRLVGKNRNVKWLKSVLLPTELLYCGQDYLYHIINFSVIYSLSVPDSSTCRLHFVYPNATFLTLRVFSFGIVTSLWSETGDRGGTVVKVLCYKSEGRWFDTRWCQWNFSLT
jgi:hypothetical protein